MTAIGGLKQGFELLGLWGIFPPALGSSERPAGSLRRKPPLQPLTHRRKRQWQSCGIDPQGDRRVHGTRRHSDARSEGGAQTYHNAEHGSELLSNLVDGAVGLGGVLAFDTV